MRVLIATVAHDAKMYALPQVVEAIHKMIDNTPHEADYYICASDKRTVKLCEDNGIRHETISFSRETFNKNIRTIDVNYGGYDEFYLYKIMNARNMCFNLASREEYDYIFFIDADNLVEPDALNLLLEADKKDISGWYFFKNAAYNAGKEDVFNAKEPYVVDFVPTGCRLIHKDVFKGKTFEFRSMASDDTIITMETHKRGYLIWVHPAVYSDHIGSDYTYEARNYRDANTQ